MNKQDLIKKIKMHKESAVNNFYDSQEETVGFINAMDIAITLTEQLSAPPQGTCDLWSIGGAESRYVFGNKVNGYKCLNCNGLFFGYAHQYCPLCGNKIEKIRLENPT